MYHGLMICRLSIYIFDSKCCIEYLTHVAVSFRARSVHDRGILTLRTPSYNVHKHMNLLEDFAASTRRANCHSDILASQSNNFYGLTSSIK